MISNENNLVPKNNFSHPEEVNDACLIDSGIEQFYNKQVFALATKKGISFVTLDMMKDKGASKFEVLVIGTELDEYIAVRGLSPGYVAGCTARGELIIHHIESEYSLSRVIKVRLPLDFPIEEAIYRYPLLGFEVAPSYFPMKNASTFRTDEEFKHGDSNLECTRMVLVNKKNIYTVCVERGNRVTFQQMLRHPVDIEWPRQNVSVLPKEGGTEVAFKTGNGPDHCRIVNLKLPLV
jgi:hypothetical protein